MTPEPEKWLDESVESAAASINDALKTVFDNEVFSKNPDYLKIAHLGSIIDNDELLIKLKDATNLVKSEILQLLEDYGITEFDTPLNSGEESEKEEIKIPEITTPKPEPFVTRRKALPEPEPKTVQVGKEIDVPANLQPAIVDLVESSSLKPPLLLINELQSARGIIAKTAIFETAMGALGQARLTDAMTQNKFNRRFKELITLDPSRTSEGDPSYEIVQGILEKWIDSEDINQIELGENLYRIISINTLENMLQRGDLEDCSPKRMGSYLKDASFLVKFKPVYEYDDSSGGFTETIYAEHKEQLIQILDVIADRAETELDIFEDLIDSLRNDGFLNRPGSQRAASAFQHTIQELAHDGCESAEAFLQQAWILF